MAFKINDTNYSEYKKIFEIFWKHQSKYFPPEIIKNASPIDVLNKFETNSKSIAKRSLKVGLQDTISQLKLHSPDLLNEIETDLAKNNLPNTQILFGSLTNTVSKVLKRKKIKTLEEFYIIKELMEDISSDIADSERKLLELYLVNFEFSTRTDK